MHELSVTQSIFDICLDAARKNRLGKISAVNIRLGCFSTFVPDSIVFYFGIMSKGSIAEHARLNFTIVKIKVKCKDCGGTAESEEPIFACPACAGPNLEILEGREFSVENIVGDEEAS
jgi:hydrogenase nickel incorporation protein HypA/HybF